MISQKSTRLTFPAFFKKSMEKHSDRNAMSFVGETPIKYSELDEKIKSLISFLEQNNIKKGDRVAILSANMPNWSVSYFAITFMGAVAVPMLPDLTTNEITNILNHSEAKVMFVSKGLAHKMKDFSNEHLYTTVQIDDFSVMSSNIKDLTYNPEATSSKEYEVYEEDMATIIYTSGTTGRSKGVMLSHKNLTFNCTKCVEFQPVNKNDRFISILPLSHTFEMTLGLLLPIFRGAEIFYLKRPPVASVLIPAMKKVKPTIILAVPLIIEKIYKTKIQPQFKKSKTIAFLYKIPFARKRMNVMAGKKLMETFGGQVHFFGVGGAKLDINCEKFLREAKFPYAIGYGLTETSPMIAGATPSKTKLQAAGPTPTEIEMKIHNPNPATGEGEVWARGNMVMMGYYKEPGLTKDVITEDGWFKTGDLGSIDKDGYVSIRGRIKNVIVEASGENIYPEEIEAVINNFKHVVESVVVQQKGKLVALVHFDKEELEKKYRELKKDVLSYVDTKADGIKKDVRTYVDTKTDEVVQKVDEKIDDLLRELQIYVNQNVNKNSQLQLVLVQPSPFQKTATHKIKRFLYTE